MPSDKIIQRSFEQARLSPSLRDALGWAGMKIATQMVNYISEEHLTAPCWHPLLLGLDTP